MGEVRQHEQPICLEPGVLIRYLYRPHHLLTAWPDPYSKRCLEHHLKRSFVVESHIGELFVWHEEMGEIFYTFSARDSIIAFIALTQNMSMLHAQSKDLKNLPPKRHCLPCWPPIATWMRLSVLLGVARARYPPLLRPAYHAHVFDAALKTGGVHWIFDGSMTRFFFACCFSHCSTNLSYSIILCWPR